MLDADHGAAPLPDGHGLHIGIVQARFNAPVTNALTNACKQVLRALGVAEGNITHLTVPGALEIPIALDALAQRSESAGDEFEFDALIAIGCVIRGETYHFELVANESAAGITRVALEMNIPIANAILTVETPEQAEERLGKGAEAARVAVEMARLLEQQRQ